MKSRWIKDSERRFRKIAMERLEKDNPKNNGKYFFGTPKNHNCSIVWTGIYLEETKRKG